MSGDQLTMEKWSQFKSDFGRRYASVEEELYRLSIFKENLAFIAKNSNAQVTFGINEFADLSSQEFKAAYLGAVRPTKKNANLKPSKKMTPTANFTLPASVDWTAQGDVNPPKNQGACGSCWAFSAVAAIESAYAVYDGLSGSNLVSLSEEQLVQCSGSYGNEGCNGGWMNSSFAYAEVHPLCTEVEYKYTSGSGVTGKCDTNKEVLGKYGVADYDDVPEGDCLALAEALVNQPVSVAVDALTWQLYITGTLPHGICGHNLDHGVLLTGYTENYWVIKNSWGSGWGMKGYIHIARDGSSTDNAKSDTCGVCLAASYPKVPAAPAI